MVLENKIENTNNEMFGGANLIVIDKDLDFDEARDLFSSLKGYQSNIYGQSSDLSPISLLSSDDILNINTKPHLDGYKQLYIVKMDEDDFDLIDIRKIQSEFTTIYFFNSINDINTRLAPLPKIPAKQ